MAEGEDELNLTMEMTNSSLSSSDSMISRLCGGKRQLNSNHAGRLRFFGPTSSLHLTESVISSVLIRESLGTRHQLQWQDDFPVDVQDYLLNLYWTFQHLVMPCIHKDAFLNDMKNGETRYCSKLLVYCILTRAAAICDQPWIRGLALSDDAEDDPPYLVRKCVQLLETELDNPGITTAQSLQLLSEMHCAVSHDTKGWMYAGGAGRLAYELGLHSNTECLDANISPLSQEVRQIVMWSCFNLDREWALYLGRPHSMRLEDISVQKPGFSGLLEHSFESKLSAAWTGLLVIVGEICDILNGHQNSDRKTVLFDRKLHEWSSNLHPDLLYQQDQLSAVFLLHMQHAAARILIHRPSAQFGKAAEVQSPESKASRQVCIENAYLIAKLLQNYAAQYGSVSTMSWIALHMIATASTTLIAAAVERRDRIGAEQYLSPLKTCLESLNALEKSHVVTRRVKKVIQQAMRLLNLDANLALISHTWNQASTTTLSPSAFPRPLSEDLNLPPVPLLDYLPTGCQFDMLNSFNSYFT
jgi:hypothetical protein